MAKYAAQFRSGRFDGKSPPLRCCMSTSRVVSAECGDLRFEGGALVVTQRETVRAVPMALQAVHFARPTVRGALETTDHRGACGATAAIRWYDGRPVHARTIALRR